MDIQVTSEGFKTAAFILGTLSFYYAYYYIAHSQRVVIMVNSICSVRCSNLALFLFRKLTGFFILGVVPAILYFGLLNGSGDKFGVSFNHLISSFLLIAGLVLLTAVILYFHHRRKPHMSTLQLNPPEWSISLFVVNTLGWGMYLIAYEFLFRGILLFECFEVLGFWPAVAINVSIYSAIHMVYGKAQTIGAIVFGILACYFALSRETLLIPVFMHLSLSILSDYYSVRKLQKPEPVLSANLKAEET